MKVAIFTDTYYPQVNGVARTLKRLTDYFQEVGIEYELFMPELEANTVYQQVHQFSSLPFIFYPECRAALVLPATIVEKVEAFSPDIIHVTTPLTMGLLGTYTAKRLNIPLVSSYHTHFDQYLDYYKMAWLSPLLWRYMKWFYNPSERIFVPSEETRQHLHQHGFSNMSIWSRGVDCKQYHPFYDKLTLREKYNIKEQYICLYVGRLAPEKDLDTLMATINQVDLVGPLSVHWLIVGDGPSYQEICQATASKTNVTMTGYLKGEELAACYSVADLFVFPSQTETFGNVVLEALASGTPAIVCDRGGVQGIVKDHETGIICRAGDANHFRTSIEKVITEKGILDQLSKNARNYALSQTWDSIFARLVDEYEAIVYEQLHRNLKHA